ncbi:recombinase family protein [Thalassotalea piscium]
MQSKNDKPLVISYLRWSSGVQKFGDSERRQLKQASKWLEKNGYEVNEDYILTDDGKSAYYSENFSDNGALGKFCNEVKLGKIPKGTVLIIEDFSRFSRAKVRLAQQRFLELINGGIRIYIAKDDTEYNEDNYDMVNMFVSLAKMTAAREESERKSHHLTEFWDGARQKADSSSESNEYPVILPSNAPDWLKKIKGQDKQKYFQPIEERVTVIKRIFELADVGGDDGLGLGSTIIVRVLESEGVKPFKGEKGNTAKSFNDSYVLRLLKDQRLLGYLQPFLNPVDENTGKRNRTPVGEPIANYFPPIIDQKLFERVNFKIQQRKIYQGGKVSRKFTNLFTKIGKCSYCGSSMTLFTKRGSMAEGGRSAYLQCSEGTKLRKCGNRAVRYFDTFEKTIIKTLKELDLSSLFQKSSGIDNEKIAEKRNEIYELQNKQKEIETKLENATDLLLTDPSDEDIVSARIYLKNQRGILASKVETLNNELVAVNRKSSYQEFKDNLEIVIDSFSEADEIAVYSKRRAINTYLIDIIQYIAIDGVKQEAWVVFDISFEINRITKHVEMFLKHFLKDQNDFSIELEPPSDKEIGEIKVFGKGGITPHLKIKLKRFNNEEPKTDDIMALRESFEVAPNELVKINDICNLAINRNWKSNKRTNYRVLNSETHKEITKELSEALFK